MAKILNVGGIYRRIKIILESFNHFFKVKPSVKESFSIVTTNNLTIR